MIHPSYVDLMKVVNQNVEEGEIPVINSRYSIVMATAKRARQIVNGDEPLIEDAEGRKPLSVAVEELNEAKIRILTEEERVIEEEKARKEREELEAARLKAQEEAEAAGLTAEAEKEEKNLFSEEEDDDEEEDDE